MTDKTTPTAAQINRAALAWCGAKDRETFHDDILYFRANWWALPGLRKWVEQEVARDA
jgi:hypothetical protein